MGRVFFHTRKNMVAIAAAKTIIPSDSGSVFMINQASAFDIALPAVADAQEGWNCRFILGTAAANAVTISATAGDGDNIIARGLDMEDGAVGTETQGVDVITFISGALAGDEVKLITDGTSWFATSIASDKAHITYS